MNIIKSNNSKNVVSLEELVPQHDCLKLLILHTPYTLKIDTLHLCINLVKLDLSKNNLQAFPYLGNLVSLKFMFIHENKLDIDQLKGIFEESEGQRSKLSENIVWITFWGNKHSFLARHFLINSTNAIAVDKNMIAPQEKDQTINQNEIAFSQLSDISELLQKKQVINRHASQDQYMKELWKQMSFLRKKQQKLYPVMKIQKVFRGWIQRQKEKRKAMDEQRKKAILNQYFYQWLQYAKKQKKLIRILQQSGKQHYLRSVKEMKKRQIELKLIELAKKAKNKVLLRRVGLRAEFKFYTSLMKNMYMMRSLYAAVSIQESKSIYIQRQFLQVFQKVIIPFVKASNPDQIIKITQNKNLIVREFFDLYNLQSKEFIKILQTQIKSKMYFVNFQSQHQTKKKKKTTLTMHKLKHIYKNLHFSTAQTRKMKDICKSLNTNAKLNLEELVVVEGNLRVLKDLVRGIYFYNTGVLQSDAQAPSRILFLSEYMIRRNASAVKIQKMWRGYSFRKNNNEFIKNYLQAKRAAIILQRWMRKYPNYARDRFIHRISTQLKKITSNSFYIEKGQYFESISTINSLKGRLKFLEQHISPYINSETDQINIYWAEDHLKEEIAVNFSRKKLLFNRRFLKQILQCNDAKIDDRFSFKKSITKECQFNHLFHFKTTNCILAHNGKKYIEFICQDKFQSKLRVLAILLLTTTVNQNKKIQINGINDFSSYQRNQRMPINHHPSSFITNQNAEMLKNCEKRFKNKKNVDYYMISNRIYLQDNDKKPTKLESKLFIYLVDYLKVEERPEIQKDIDIRGKKQVTKQLQVESYFLTEHQSANTDRISDQNININDVSLRTNPNMKIIVNKRSVKQFKVERKNKPKQQHSFMLDSVSINDRLATQPDLNPTMERSSLRQNLSEKKLIQDTSIIERGKGKSTFESKYEAAHKRKELDMFTKRFINLNNFIQNQYASENKRRLNVELQTRALQSAQKIKQYKQKSASQKQKHLIQRQKKARQSHSNHKDLLQKNQLIIKEHQNRLKTQASIEREKRYKERSKLKKLKVSFAEECFPLVSKSKQSYQLN